MTATDELRRLLDERGVEYKETTSGNTTIFNFDYCEQCDDYLHTIAITGACISAYLDYLEPKRAIAATLGRPKVKSHPYGYEPDTGAFCDTRCECGCLNDISAKYCNGCGGEIEIDEHAEKEIYHIPALTVFAEKHDDGSLEFCERRYVPEDAATLGEADEGCYLMRDGKKFPVELDYGFLGIMPISITVGGFRYLLEVPNGK